MAQPSPELKATARPRAGKGAARQARREGKVPAVIYGDGKPPETIALDYNELWKQVLKGHFTSTVFEVDVEGKKNRVIPRDLQVDPVKDQPIHVDFLRIGKDGRIRVAVPVRFVNEALSPGLKRGGVLNIVRHDIEVTCPYDKIPAFFEIDLTGLEIGRSMHVSAIAMPEGRRADHQGPRLHDRHDRRRREAGRGSGRGGSGTGGRCCRCGGGRRRRGGSGCKGRSACCQGCSTSGRQGRGTRRQGRRQEEVGRFIRARGLGRAPARSRAGPRP